MKILSPILVACLAAAMAVAVGPGPARAQSSLYLPADDPAYAHLTAFASRGRTVAGETFDVLPWTNGHLRALAHGAEPGMTNGPLARLARDLLRAATPQTPTSSASGPSSVGASEHSDPPTTVGFRLRAGIRAASQERLDLLRLQPEREVGLYPFIHLEPFLESGRWSAVLGARHDVFYDQDPDAFDTALRLMVRMENAYVRYDGPVVGLMIGRTHRHWGLPGRAGLLVSTNPRPMDQIAFRIGPDRVRLRSVLSELDSITADGRFTGTAGDDSVAVGSERRFLAAHHLQFKLTHRLSVRLSHATLYSGAGSGLSLKYLNPMNVAIFATDNLPKNDENNGLVAAAATYASDGLLLFAEAALDDFDLLNGKEPSSLSATGSLYAAELLPLTDISAGITVVTSRAYNAPQPEGKYVYLNRGIATQWSDYIHAELELKWFGLLQSMGLVVSPRIDVLLQGSQDIRAPYPDREGVGTILADPVTRTVRPGLDVHAGVGTRVSLLIKTGYNVVSIDGGGGTSDEAFTAGVHLLVRFSDAWAL